MSQTPSNSRLFTPGPINCAPEVLAAMQTDLGSREQAFIDTVRNVRSKLLQVAELSSGDGYTAIPMQGSGTFAIESALLTLTKKTDKVLIIENGAYGTRLLKILQRAGHQTSTVSSSATEAVDLSLIQEALEQDSTITHLAVVHCETTTGMLNPIEDIAKIAQSHGLKLIVDAMSSFGAIPINFLTLKIDCLIASANKCLESVPGFAFVIAKESSLENCQGNSPSISLDLYEQWKGLERNGQFRFTPPTHSFLAFDCALDLFFAEGGTTARNQRFANNQKRIVDGMAKLGLLPILTTDIQSPIITAFPYPKACHFNFDRFYQSLAKENLLIYPGKLGQIDSFRIGSIGQISHSDIDRLLRGIASFLNRESREPDQK